ncbi:MAG: hypothetical protein ACK56I_14030, partial [bacterium]
HHLVALRVIQGRPCSVAVPRRVHLLLGLDPGVVPVPEVVHRLVHQRVGRDGIERQGGEGKLQRRSLTGELQAAAVGNATAGRGLGAGDQPTGGDRAPLGGHQRGVVHADQRARGAVP